MRLIAGLIIVGLLGWCGWWFVGSTGQKEAWTRWFSDRQGAGWVAEAAEINVRGFPNRFDTTLERVALADPASGWAWSAPFFQVLMLSYQPNHVIAVWPETQKLSSPAGTVDVLAKTMRGSVKFVPNTDLTLESTQIEIADFGINGGDWSAGLKSANFATRRVAPGNAPDFAHQIGLNATELVLSDRLRLHLDPTGLLPAKMDTAHLDMTAAFDAPWDRHSLEGVKPRLTAASIKSADILWGELRLSANGSVDVDASGYPSGEINVTAQNWEELVDLAEGAGVISRDLAGTVKSGLGFFAALTGDGKTLNAPLTFSGGFVRLGPIPIGPAPRLIFD